MKDPTKEEDNTEGWYIAYEGKEVHIKASLPVVGRYSNTDKESMFRIEPLGHLPEEEDDIAPYLIQISPTMERYIYSIPCAMFRKLFGRNQWRVDEDSELCFIHPDTENVDARHIVLLSANDDCAYEIHVQIA